jgi:hypothetical protein
MNLSNKFKIKNPIGFPDAEEDMEMLRACFMETESFKEIATNDNPTRLLIGRTGAGKSATLIKLAEKYPKKVVTFNPEILGVQYVLNSDLFHKLEEIGVNLDPLFKFMWRHVLFITLLRKKYPPSASTLEKIIEELQVKVRNRSEVQKAKDYLDSFGDSFFNEHRKEIEEISKSIEKNIEAELGTQFNTIFNADLSGGICITDIQKQTIRSQVNQIIGRGQSQKIHSLHSMLNAVFDDRQQNYYLTIDKLDDGWTDDQLRYRLIKGLLEAVKDFSDVKNIKLIVALRKDILEKVLEIFDMQKEKYDGIATTLQWRREELIQVLESRINYLFEHKYKKSPISYKEIFSETVKELNGVDYFLSRTLMRPRDVILFFNDCVEESLDNKFTEDTILTAEEKYSPARLEALKNEWKSVYPSLDKILKIFENQEPRFQAEKLNNHLLQELILELATSNESCIGVLEKQCSQYANNNKDTSEKQIQEFKEKILQILYLIGFIGIKKNDIKSVLWSYSKTEKVSTASLRDPDTSFIIHPAFWKALAIKSKGFKCNDYNFF